MILLEAPYVSPFLARSAADSGAPLLRTAAAMEALGPLRAPLLDDAEFAARYRPGARLYTNSENALGWVYEHLAHTSLPRACDTMKDKVRFRELVADLDPTYRFTELRRSDFAAFDSRSMPTPFVVKPAVGFFSLGVHVVERAEDWPGVRAKLEADCDRFAGLYPAHVLDLDRFVVEEMIQGREFAVDAYLDGEGRAVVVGILEHPFASGADVSDRVYFTEARTIDTWREPFETYLTQFGERARLRDFPFHVELRVDEAGTIRPIEANPLRFGGWCAADIAHHAWGFDPYHLYLRNARPDWDAILASRRDSVWALVVGDLPAGVDRSVQRVDLGAFAARFTDVLELRAVEDPRHPVFAFTFVRVPRDDRRELDWALRADLTEFLRPLSA